jgi:dTDP-4-amino-4,6-dideoxygalactose transaminase
MRLKALLSGFWAAWFTDGSSARRALEVALRLAYAPKELYLTDSGTSALTLALQVAHETTQAPVALPAYCCFDVATAADGAGVPFFLYDIEPGTLSPDLTSLRRAFGAGTRSVVVAHLYGVPVDLARVQALAAEFGAIVIEDAAQASGCEWHGRPAGAHGALGVLSFGRGKGVTGGKGGALFVNDERLRPAAAAAWNSATGPRQPRGSLRDYLLLKAQWLFGRPFLYWIPASVPFLGLGETIYHEPHSVGGITTLAAGVLARTIPLVPAEVVRRRATASRLLDSKAGPDPMNLPADWTAGWLRYPVVLQRTADSVLIGYHVRAGVMRGYPKALADLPGFGNRRLNIEAEFPGARILAERLITIPTHRFVRSAKVPAF